MRGYVLQDTTQKVLVLRVKARTQCNGGRGQELTNTNLFELFLLVLLF